MPLGVAAADGAPSCIWSPTELGCPWPSSSVLARRAKRYMPNPCLMPCVFIERMADGAPNELPQIGHTAIAVSANGSADITYVLSFPNDGTKFVTAEDGHQSSMPRNTAGETSLNGASAGLSKPVQWPHALRNWPSTTWARLSWR